MSSQEIEVLVIGAGQAGVAMSEHLSNNGVPHLVVERHRIAERWRSGACGTPWSRTGLLGTTAFPVWSSPISIPMLSASKEQVAEYFVAYAEKIAAPIRARCRGDIRA